MAEKFQVHTVQNLIGYTFKNPSLLVNAFTHPSAAEKPDDSNEGLCFLGKSVCELLIRDYMYSNFMKLEAVKVSVSNAEVRVAPLLKKVSDHNGLAEYMLLSKSASALRLSRTVESDLFLALVGAIYKDGGMPSARAYVLPKLRAVISDDDPELMREAKKDIIKKAGNERDIFSDHSDTKEKRSASSTLRTLFSSKKRKTESEEKSPKTNTQSDAQNIPATTEPARNDSYKEHLVSDEHRQRKTSKQLSPAHVAAEINGELKTPSDENYKSALQEYVQKNIRSATVMLEYKDTRASDGSVTEIYLFGKKVARASGANKRESSQNAAKQAYRSITASSGENAEWFRKLKNDPESVINAATVPAELDHISELNRIYQKKFHRSDASVKYESVTSKTKRMLAYTVTADGKQLGYGEGKTAKEAKQNAAKNALASFNKK